MMEVAVRLSRATSTSIEMFLGLPLLDLDDWVRIIADVINSENNNGR
jgi:hypothetical protein